MARFWPISTMANSGRSIHMPSGSPESLENGIEIYVVGAGESSDTKLVLMATGGSSATDAGVASVTQNPGNGGNNGPAAALDENNDSDSGTWEIDSDLNEVDHDSRTSFDSSGSRSAENEEEAQERADSERDAEAVVENGGSLFCEEDRMAGPVDNHAAAAPTVHGFHIDGAHSHHRHDPGVFHFDMNHDQRHNYHSTVFVDNSSEPVHHGLTITSKSLWVDMKVQHDHFCQSFRCHVCGRGSRNIWLKRRATATEWDSDSEGESQSSGVRKLPRPHPIEDRLDAAAYGERAN